jgi:membrane-associated phospholipid phosphatase
LLLAYWSVDWAPKRSENYELVETLIGWDRVVLRDWALGTGVERLGQLLPTVLELVYLSLYAVLPLVIGSFYLRRERHRVDEFVFPFLLGTLAVYALLPHFAVEAPRFRFAHEDLPRFEPALRRVNVWILDSWDIRSSVFPSGHVAAAVSAAIAVRLASPDRSSLAAVLVLNALLVWVNTIYSRYHYAADGLASIAISALVLGVRAAYQRARERRFQ